MSNIEEPQFGPQLEARQKSARETAELLKRAAEHLLKISIRLDDHSLVDSEVERILHASVQELTTEVYLSRKEPSKNIVDGSDYDWTEIDARPLANE